LLNNKRQKLLVSTQLAAFTRTKSSRK